MNELHMRAYYWTFEPTGEMCADRILSAVASAGKAAHNTSEWSDENDATYYGQEGSCPWEWIENAAKITAQEVRELRDLLRRYQEDGAVFMDAKRYRVMVENGVVPSEWHEIITSAREGFRQRADEAFDEFVKALSDYEGDDGK